MKYFRAAFARIAGLFGRNRADQDMHDELASHIEMQTADNIRRGMDPAEARRQAMLSTGGIAAAEESVRDRRGIPWIESVFGDVRYALRTLRHSPAFTAVVIVTLALGIGANTAIFSVVRGVLLKPLPHRDGDRLVYLRHSGNAPGSDIEFSVPEVRDFRTGVPSLAGIAEYSPWFGVLQGDHDVVRLNIGLVTGNFFEVMGLSPVLGRLTRPSEDGGGVAPVMVLTHAFWIQHFGGDSSVVGRQVTLDGNSITVIGVLQPAPYFPDRVEVFTNMVISPHHVGAMMVQTRTHRMTEVVARLAPGATITQVRNEVAAMRARVLTEFKESYDPKTHFSVAVVPFKEAIGENARLTLLLLMSAAAFVLIICAANVTNLTLMRRVRRQHELVVRVALGAGASRLRRLLLIENLLLTLGGGVLGIAIAVGGVSLLTSVAARYSARANEISLDSVVLGFTLALSVALALLLSFAASLPKQRELSASVSAGTGRVSGSRRKQRVQRALVVAQVAVSVVLLAGAGLLTRTMIRLSNVRTGLSTEEVLTMPVPLLNPGRVGPGQIAAADVGNKVLYDRMRSEIRALPGVVDVGLGSAMPLRTAQFRFQVSAEGKTPAVGEATPPVDFRTASPGYFHSAGIPVRRGRDFLVTDELGAGRVIVVNQTLVDRFFPGEDPIGKRISLSDPMAGGMFSGDWRTIVGVVGNTQDGGLEAKPRLVLFAPFAQEVAIAGGLVIRADSNAAALAAAATRIVRRIAPLVPIENVLTVTQIKEESLAPRRLNAELISLFGMLALMISAVGIAGVLAFSVSVRTNEIGIRMSLGADRGQVQRMVLREGGVLVVGGLLAGGVGAYFATNVLRGFLFDVAPRDPLTFVGVGLTMSVIGLVACWIPARRASRVDPAITMRS